MKQFWFVVGSQDLYGEEVLKTVAERAEEMAAWLSEKLPYPLVYKVTAMSSGQITKVIKEANYDDDCLGVVTWCHTFSPSKMWLTGLAMLQKPWCHLATQYNKEIPNEEIDMDFMNLNQAAHGDREHGFMGARLRKARKVIAGYWKEENVIARLAEFEKVCVGIDFSKNLKVMRFGDNMRDVAVTEGDKVEAQNKLGWEVNFWAVRNRHEEDDGQKRLQGVQQHFPGSLRHGAAPRTRIPAPYGPGLRLWRRGRLESQRYDSHPQEDGRRRERRFRIHGGLHLSPC